jgi:hypothetical protein
MGRGVTAVFTTRLIEPVMLLVIGGIIGMVA